MTNPNDAAQQPFAAHPIFADRSGAADRLADRYRSATVVLFADRGKRLPEVLGASLLFLKGGRVFLLTAAHVIDAFQQDRIRMSTPSTFPQLRGSSVAHAGLDAAVIQLDEHLVTDELIDAALTINDLDFAPGLRNGWYALLGAPPNEVKVSEGNLVRMRPGCWSGQNADDDVYTACARSRDEHLILEFDVERAFNHVGQRQQAKFFRGVSGSGLWRLPAEGEREVEGRPGLLAAVFTDYEWRSIIGTTVGVHMRLLRELHPGAFGF